MSLLTGGQEGPRYMTAGRVADGELRRLRIEGSVAVGREAITLPLLFLTVSALGGVRVAQGGSLALVCSDQNITKIFEITGLDRVFPIHATRDEALSSVASGAE